MGIIIRSCLQTHPLSPVISVPRTLQDLRGVGRVPLQWLEMSSVRWLPLPRPPPDMQGCLSFSSGMYTAVPLGFLPASTFGPSPVTWLSRAHPVVLQSHPSWGVTHRKRCISWMGGVWSTQGLPSAHSGGHSRAVSDKWPVWFGPLSQVWLFWVPDRSLRDARMQ